MPAVRVMLVLAAAGIGALVVVGCGLAALFELQGFATPPESEPRAGRLALFGLGIVVGAAGPLIAWRILLPESAPAIAVVVGVAAVVLVISLLGISLGS